MKKNNNCQHEIIWNDKIKVMTNPNTRFGYCKKCGKSCKKVNDNIIWEKEDN